MTEPFKYDHGAGKTTTVVCSEPTGVKPVVEARAWAVVDKDGVMDIKSITHYSERADQIREKLDRLFGEYSPFSVIRVQITPIPEPSPGPGPSSTAYDDSGFAHEGGE